MFAGSAGKHHQKRGFLGGLAALQASLRRRSRSSFIYIDLIALDRGES
jgi:hypothetical protein